MSEATPLDGSFGGGGGVGGVEGMHPDDATIARALAAGRSGLLGVAAVALLAIVGRLAWLVMWRCVAPAWAALVRRQLLMSGSSETAADAKIRLAGAHVRRGGGGKTTKIK